MSEDKMDTAADLVPVHGGWTTWSTAGFRSDSGVTS
jgi:hypothetical protein